MGPMPRLRSNVAEADMLQRLITLGHIGWAVYDGDGHLVWRLAEAHTGAMILDANSNPIDGGQFSKRHALPVDTFISEVKLQEGCVPHLYLDTSGKVTVGYGHMLTGADAAVELHRAGFTFVARTNICLSNELESPKAAVVRIDQIRLDFHTISHMKAGQIASAYGKAALVQLSGRSMERLLVQDVRDVAVKGVKSRFNQLHTYPEEAQLVLLDFMYNLGATKFNSLRWPKFHHALSVRDWKGMSEECDRIDGAGNKLTKRNQRTRALLLSAHKKEPYFIYPKRFKHLTG